ncbi:MAG TPA: hypothetical protein VH020_15260 [Stellaceae bacterium]|nr:hypothetical protein [Stellaceae bacterium]
MTEFDEKIFLDLIARVYDAALNATLWRQADLVPEVLANPLLYAAGGP